MARLPRIVVAGQPLHIVQRGNNRQAVFFADEDRRRYVDDLRETAASSLTRVGRIPPGASATVCGDSVVEKTDYGYDLKGRLSTITYPNGSISYWKYDGATGLVSEAGHKQAATLIYSDSYSYYPNSRLYRSIVHSAATGSNETTYKYDDYQRLTEVLSSDGRKTVYSYDTFGNRQSETLTGPAGGAKAPGNYIYHYAANSNRLASIEYNGTPLESYGYDNAGRLTTRTGGTGVVTTYGYDVRGLLTRVTSPGQTITYSYDALGTRKSKTVNGALTYYITAPLFGLSHVLMELDPSKNIQATYVYGGNQQLIEEPIASDRTKDLYLLHDGTVGSVTHAIDRTGTIKNHYQYDAFGSRTVQTATGLSYKHYGYTGEEQDAETGLVYLRARYYDPSLGRFISADPYWGRMAEPVSQNRFIYVQNNPLGLVDPSGMDAYSLLSYESAAGDFGHMAAIVGNKDMGYYFSTMARDDKTGFQSIKVVWRDSLESAQRNGSILNGYFYNKVAKVETTQEQDLNMVIKTMSQAQEGIWGVDASTIQFALVYQSRAGGIADSPRSYGLITNNCGRSAYNIFSAGGIDSNYDVAPNAYFNNIIQAGAVLQ